MGSRKFRGRKDVQYALAHGWEFCGISGRGHLSFRHPDTPMKLRLSATPSDGRGALNAISWIRKHTPQEETG